MAEKEYLEGRFIYKCRNCGHNYEGGACTVYHYMQAHFFAFVGGYKVSKEDEYPKAIEIHSCAKNQIGIGDLAGFITYNSAKEQYGRGNKLRKENRKQ